GVKALSAFFNSLPEETGMAFIVIVHPSPDYESNMAKFLQTQTSLEVLQVNKKVNIEAEHVYVIPPQKIPAVGDNHLEPSEQEQKHGLASIDQFFRSLAEEKGEQEDGVYLSVTGHDGPDGMWADEAAGG